MYNIVRINRALKDKGASVVFKTVKGVYYQKVAELLV